MRNETKKQAKPKVAVTRNYRDKLFRMIFKEKEELLSLFNAINGTEYDNPEDVVEEAELKKMLAEALELLTEKERRVIELYYYEDMTLKEISKILSVSESRVSQLHTKALLKMKKKMGPYMNILTD